MPKLKKVFTDMRVIFYLVCLLLLVVAIHPNPFNTGVAIRSVGKNSSAEIAGIVSPKPTATPMSRERILSINNLPIKNEEDYYNVVSALEPLRTITIKTNKALYKVEIKSDASGKADLGLKVYNAPTTNIRKGIELEGGTRVLLQPETKLSQDDMSTLIENMKERLNVYGLSDVSVRPANDLSGNQYVLIEIAGVNEEEVKDLLARQGKFEAKIGNETVFRGGNDITYVCRSADCSGLDSQYGCSQTGDGYVCRFSFSISLDPLAAERQANLTQNLETIVQNNEEYLNETLDLYLDDQKVDTLNIGSDLKGRAVTDIAISGAGSGTSQEIAIQEALSNMKRLQTILITGSLPVKINIVKTDALSPSLGQEFVRNSLLMGVLAAIAVALIIFLRYKKWQITLLNMTVVLSEITMTLGVAAIIGWNIDLAAIAGIIIAIGSGVNDQIIIVDETLRGEQEDRFVNWKDRIKKALFIIMAAYSITCVAMVPLMFAGAGLLKGFALTTIIGVSIGVFITRPAFAHMIEILMKED